MRKKTISILVISLVLVGGLTTGLLLWNNNKKNNGDNVEIAYYAFNSEPILNWDPSVSFSNGLIVLNNVYQTLLKYHPDTGDFEHILATDYEHTQDGLNWTFTLRENVTFHDGTPFNASAVKFSVERTMEIGQGASYIWFPVKEINVLGEYQVQFVLNYPTALDLVVSTPYSAFMMSPTAIQNNPDTWFEDGNEAGTGPYQLESTVAGDEVVLTKYENYWGGWEGQHFDKVIIKRHTETSTRRQLLESGDADITGELPAEDIEALKTESGVTVVENPSFTNMIAFFNTEKAPLNDSRVRKALTYAFPYQDVVDYAAGGYANQSTGVIPDGLWGHSDDLFQYNFNLTKAQNLLEDAGISSGDLNLALTYSSGDETEKKTAELYKAELSKIGVELTIQGLPWSSQWEKAKNEDPADRQDIFLMYWWPDISSPYSWLYSLYHTEDSILFNLAYYSNSTVDDLMDTADASSGTNQTEAENKFIEAQSIILDDCPSIFIYDRKDVFVITNSFKGFEYNPSYPNTVFFYDCYRDTTVS